MKTMTYCGTILACGFVVLALQTMSKADVITETLNPTGDSWIDRSTPDDVKNTTNNFIRTLGVRGHSTSTYKSYIEFDLTGIDLANVSEVRLKLTSTGSSGAAQIWTNVTFHLFGAKDVAWDQDTLTWNNAPLNLTTSHYEFDATPLGTFNNNTGAAGYYAFSSAALTNLVKTATTDGTITIMIGTPGTAAGEWGYLGSSENTVATNRPVLEVDMVPEPGTAALAALGGLAMLWRRRV